MTMLASVEGPTGCQMEPVGQHDSDVGSDVVFALLTPDNAGFNQ